MSEQRSIIEQIAHDARINRRARMLPTDRPLTPDEIAQVARDVGRWMREDRRSLASVSKALGAGFSQATISQFVNGHARGDQERVARALNEYMERNARVKEAQRPREFVETDVARRMLVVIRTAVESSSMGVIVGPAGVGKTLTLRAAASMYTGSLLVRVTQTERRATGLINSLARVLGVPARSSAATVQRLVIDHLRGSGRPLLIDEAHKLHPGALEVVRDLHDEAEVPAVLCGTIDLRRQVSDTDMFYGQFSSRIVAHVDVTEIAASPRRGRPARPLYSVEEVVQIFSSHKLRLSDDGAKFLCELACLPGLGSLRLCAKIMDLAARLPAVRAKGVASADDLRAICRQMHGHAFTTLAETRRDQLKVAV
ncbi:MAG: hypothetical protein BroJett004_08170 [Planctomycetota bacterium]|nr:MAG: hypothetical protein BroJett004_08170 [Planctomycetota bacterium]